MVGYISNAVANAIKNWPALRAANIVPILATDGDSVAINTSLPAVAVHVLTGDGAGDHGVALGGGIRVSFELALYVMLPILNYSFSPDRGKQAALLDMSDEVLRCMEQTNQFVELERVYDFSIQFDRMEIDKTYGTQGANTVAVDVHKVIYQGSVQFDPRDDRYPDAELERVDLYDGDKNIKSVVI